MKIHLLAVGQKMPSWVEQGYRAYAERLPRHMPLQLRELPLAARGRNPDLARLRREEAESIRDATPEGARLVALDPGGRPWSTEELARRLERWRQEARDVALVIGGPDGLDPEWLERAGPAWSLGPLTLPHPLVRIVVAEQLYRAWSILQNHPYHRA